jgi:hypothetical protein
MVEQFHFPVAVNFELEVVDVSLDAIELVLDLVGLLRDFLRFFVFRLKIFVLSSCACFRPFCHFCLHRAAP